MKNNEITMKAEKNGLLPTVDAYAFYGASQLAGGEKPDGQKFATGAAEPPGTFPADFLWDGHWELVQQFGAGQGRGREHHHSAAQPGGAGGPGAVADGVPPGTDAVAATLHAGPDPGDQRAICVDQRPSAGERGAGGARLCRAVAGRGAEIGRAARRG